MKWSPLLLLLLSLQSTSLAAQHFGFQAGILSSKLNLTAISDQHEAGDAPSGFLFGLLVELPLANGLISLQPELNYAERNFTLLDNSPFSTSLDYLFSYLELGGLLKLNFIREQSLNPYLGIGAFYNFAISGNIDTGGPQNVEIDFDEQSLRRSEVLLAAAAGLNFTINKSVFFLEGRYYSSLNDQSLSEILEVKHRSFGGIIGVKISILP